MYYVVFLCFSVVFLNLNIFYYLLIYKTNQNINEKIYKVKQY